MGDRFYIKATATFTDIEKGESIKVDALAREDLNKKGMDLAQITGSVSSYARKYALNGLFCIDDTKDSDATNNHGKGDKDKQSKKLSEAQVKRLYAIGAKNGYDAECVKKAVLKKYSKTKAEDLTKQEYDELIKNIEANPKK
ncbi:hypothetical protein FQB35_15635 (plasmid) [Crassaminicella thermophila]|uniref:ERF superfamily protein n=1 Tax=Crassaminicella thermophila TaxID=2599308 RepID=A0A5C0SJ78_CRATE|nr:ERF family protein [Crassaminicella thermophila]QEK13756.1 hypothetical protein FQB35_15635 [Crassaminicella thermophila]